MPSFLVYVNSITVSSPYSESIDYYYRSWDDQPMETHSFSTPSLNQGTTTFTVPSIVDLNSIRVTKVSYTGGTTSQTIDGNPSFVPSNNTIKDSLNKGQRSIEFEFSYKAYRPSDYEIEVPTIGQRRTLARHSDCVWSRFTYTIEFEYLGDVNGSISDNTIGTVGYSIFSTSLVGHETTRMIFNVKPTASAIKNGSTVEFYLASDPTISITYDVPATAKNSVYTNDFTFELSQEMIDAINGTDQLGIRAKLIDSSNASHSFSALISNFIVADERPKPTINTVTITDGTTDGHGEPLINVYSGYVANYSTPIFTISATPDTTISADTSIVSYNVKLLKIDGSTIDIYNTFTSNSNIINISASTLNSFGGKAVAIEVEAIDNYGAISIAYSTYDSGDAVNVIIYSLPSIAQLRVPRYTKSALDGTYSENALGNYLCLFGNLSWQPSVGNTSNSIHMVVVVRYMDDNTLYNQYSTVISDNSGTYVYNLTNGLIVFDPGEMNHSTYSPDTSFKITVSVYDDLIGINNRISQEIYAIKATPYFNVEKTGVAVGTISTGTIAQPLFQVAYPADFASINMFYGRPYDTGWMNLNDATYLATGNYDPWDTGNQCPYIRRIGKIVYLRGGLKVKSGKSIPYNSYLGAFHSLPEQFQPDGKFDVPVAADNGSCWLRIGYNMNNGSCEEDPAGIVVRNRLPSTTVNAGQYVSIACCYPGKD